MAQLSIKPGNSQEGFHVDFDAIVVGSGLVGVATAYRFSESGFEVMMLERGRQRDNDSHPRKWEGD